MAEVKLSAFLAGVESIAGEKPSYHLGCDGTGGQCDCIGLVIGGLRRAGGQWSGTHGSNYTARYEVAYLLPIQSGDDLNVGEVVFKAAMPGGSSYNLPSRYTNDPDQRDYYHVGIVTNNAPLEITHCTGPGIVRDVKLGKWCYRGWLNKVLHEGKVKNVAQEQTYMGTATVYAANGGAVNLRKKPNGALVDRVPVGTAVTVQLQEGGWSRIIFNGKEGWMMDQYLRWEENQDAAQNASQDAGQGTDTGSADGTISLKLTESAAQALFQALANALGKG